MDYLKLLIALLLKPRRKKMLKRKKNEGLVAYFNRRMEKDGIKIGDEKLFL